MDKGVLLSFGNGPRICIGIRFAKMKAKVAIGELVRNFDISENGKTHHPLVIDPKEFINVKTGGLWWKSNQFCKHFTNNKGLNNGFLKLMFCRRIK